MVLCVIGFTTKARALTPPMGGAVALPSGAHLLLPFPAGTRVRVSSGYGPSGGSSLHDGTMRTSSANDYYALDLVYADVADGGFGMPVVAPLRGTVVLSGWASEGWANYGQRVILRHDLGDGHVYYTLYCHLNAIDPAATEGAVIEQGQLVGELGRSCQGALSCSSFSGAHLHWAMHQDSMIGGSGTGGSYGGRAVVPEPMDGAEDLSAGDVITSTNSGGPPRCGDGVCSGGETHDGCAGDCPICEPVPAAGRIVDERELCFARGGTPMYWHEESAGWDGSLIWTEATSDAAPDNDGVWSLTFAEEGDYRLEAFTAAAFARSRRARYRIRHAGEEGAQVVDQTAADGWNAVGTFHFVAGGDQWVRLDDNTGEPVGDHVRIAFDAVRLTREGMPPPPVDAGTPPMGTDAGSPAVDAGDPPPGSDAGVSRDAGSTAMLDAGTHAEAGVAPLGGGTEGGCGCSAAGARRRPTAASYMTLAWLVAALVRRRRR